MGLFNIIFSDSWLVDALFWITSKYLEILATLTGILYLIYSIEGKKQLWVYGLVTSGLYVYICFVFKIYADMGINIYYVAVSIYGWIHWSARQTNTKEEMPISRTNSREALIIFISTSGLFVLIAWLLKRFTDSDVYLIDALTTSAGITATWMLARKMLEHWLFWIVIDAISIGLYIYKGLYPTSVLFLVYTIFAVVGYIEWKRKCQVQIQTS